jgi:hypothetical protein
MQALVHALAHRAALIQASKQLLLHEFLEKIEKKEWSAGLKAVRPKIERCQYITAPLPYGLPYVKHDNFTQLNVYVICV